MVSIRQVTIADIPTLAVVGGTTLLESHGHSAPAHAMKSYVDDKFSEASLTKEVGDPANIFHFVNFNGKPVGYSKIIYNIPLASVPEVNITKMERLYVLQKFHDLKLGHELMDYSIQLSKQQGQKGMWLVVWKENPRALRFYQRTGFKIVGEGFFKVTEEYLNPNWEMYLEY